MFLMMSAFASMFLLVSMKNRPAKSPVFSAKGPYAYCRHPMYLFLLIALWMGSVMTYGRLEFALLGSTYLIIGTFFEERNLREELGEVYNLYRENVPMWIPRLQPWRFEM
jgi:protein-S-isoprenylcysteine O-methyltransferase Ste14